MSRPLLKALSVGAAAIAALALSSRIALSVYVASVASSVPSTDDSDLRIERPEVSDEENAFAAFVAVTDAVTCSEDEKRRLQDYQDMFFAGETNLVDRDGGPLDPEKCRREVDGVLAVHADALSALPRIAAKPEYRLTPAAAGRPFPPLAVYSQANSLWQIAAARAMERGEFAAAVRILGDARRFFLKGRDNAAVTMELVASAEFANMSARHLVRLACEKDAPDELLGEIAALLRDDADDVQLFDRAVRNEYANHSYPSLFESEVFGNGESEIRNEVEQNLLTDWLRPYVKWLCLGSVYRRHAFIPAMTLRDLAAVYRAGLIEGARELDELVPEPADPLEANAGGRLLVRMIVPGFEAIRSQMRMKRFHASAAEIGVAVERYRRAHGGEGPSKLADLTPALLPKVPRDPYDADREIAYDAARGIVWTVGQTWEFAPPPENDPSLADPNVRREMQRYAARLDGRPHRF